MTGAGAYPIRLGPFAVETDRASVQEFAAAIAAPDEQHRPDDAVPHTYPIRWLTSDLIRPTVMSCCGPDTVLVQSSQYFRYRQPLVIATRYALTLEIFEAARAGADLWLDATVRDAAGATVLEMKTGLLRLSGFAAAEAPR